MARTKSSCGLLTSTPGCVNGAAEASGAVKNPRQTGITAARDQNFLDRRVDMGLLGGEREVVVDLDHR